MIYLQNELLYIYKLVSNNILFSDYHTGRKMKINCKRAKVPSKQPAIPHITGWTYNTKSQFVVLGLITRNVSYMKIIKNPNKFQVSCA
jgi:hypothetical protein